MSNKAVAPLNYRGSIDSTATRSTGAAMMAPEQHAGLSRVLRVTAFGLPLVLFGLIASLDADLVDDAYIFCRYADNIAAGHGPVFNPGERVEGFTSPMHVALVAATTLAGLPAPWATWAVSIGAGIALLLLLALAGDGPRDPDSGPLAALLLVCSLPFVAWSASGMDVMLFALTVTLVALLADRDAQRTDTHESAPRMATFVVAGAAFAVRPEGLVLLVAVAVLTLLRAPQAWRHGAWWRCIGIGVLPVIALTATRLTYYGAWLPNTYYAKMGGGGVALWLRGLEYLGEAAIALLPLGVVLLVAIAGRRCTLKLQREPATLLGVALAAAIVVEGGDFFAFHRFAVPLLPLLALLCARAITRAIDAPGRRIGIVVVVASAMLAWGWFCPAIGGGERSERDRFADEVNFTRLFDRVGQELRQALGASHRLAILTAGAIPYRTGWPTIDMLGLVDPTIARRKTELGSGTIGHEKHDSDYVLRRRPEIVLLHPWFWGEPVPNSQLAQSRFLHQAQRALLDHPDFARHYRPEWIATPSGYLAIYRRLDAPADA